jgi:serum/glucocorticoid-regulated kinase 2
MNQLIGKGSFGKVYMVQKMPNNEIFAMKVIKKSMVSSRNQVAHTKAERDIMASIKCPFIVDMKYAFQTAEKLYFVMEFLNGGELFHHLRRERKFSEERARFYSAQIIIALECLHENDIIYR